MSPIYNTTVTVVELVDADNPSDAVNALADRVRAAGFDVIVVSDEYGNAFESEDQTPHYLKDAP